MKRFLLIILCSMTSVLLFSQQGDKLVKGIVSYKTLQNVYVKFTSTAGINIGDTLFAIQDLKLIPFIEVKQRSSISCVGVLLGKAEVNISDSLYANSRDAEVSTAAFKEIIKEEVAKPELQNEIIKDSISSTLKEKREFKIRGKLSASSYSSFSNSPMDNSHRWRYTFSLNAKNIGNSRLSGECYFSFIHRYKKWDLIKENIFNGLKIYNLALTYDLGENTKLYLGRKINPNLSNVGAVDGIQFESKLKDFTVGALLGSRPDYRDYSFDFKLFEYGAFLGHNYSNDKGNIRSSIAFFEQKNNGLTDRRFVYLQQNNSLVKNVNIFYSLELDLYKTKNDIPINEINLTSLYFSVRYRPFKKLSLSASYDARRNVVYYETFKNVADSILESATRQGLRFRINYRPFKKLSIGVNTGYRYRKEDARPSMNVSTYVSYTQIPWIRASATISADLLQTSYMDGRIYGLRISRDIVQKKLYGEVSFRRVNFQFVNSPIEINEYVVELNTSWKIYKKLSLSCSIESVFESKNRYQRFYINIINRF